MAHVHLHFLASRLSFAELLSDLEKAFFYFLLHAWFELLLHVVEFEVLAFEVLEWVAFLLSIAAFHVLHDRLLTVNANLLLVLGHAFKHAIDSPFATLTHCVGVDGLVQLAVRRRRLLRHRSAVAGLS